LLAFVDESGKPHPSDPSIYSTICALCLPEQHSRAFNQALYDIVKEVYPEDDPLAKEIKAEKYLARKPFEYSAQRRQVVRRIAELVEGTPLSFFSVQMKRPVAAPNWQKTTLTPSFRLLTERIELHMREHEPDGFAKMLFDERDPGADAADSRSFRSFISGTAEGQSWSHVLDTPFFVSSTITPGIQVVDLLAGATRHYLILRDAHAGFTSDWENEISALQALARTKTRDFEMAGYAYYGMYFMPERYFDNPPGPRPLLNS